MSHRLLDGIVWLAIGVSLVVQATFLVLAVWPSAEDLASGPSITSKAVEGGIVGAALLTTGMGALYWGLQRLTLLVRRRRSRRYRR